MRMDGATIREDGIAAPHMDLEAVKAWAKRAFSKERIAEAGVVAATIVLAAYFGAVLYQAIQNYTFRMF